jgi:alcohol dehydrogenase class IV
MRWEFTTSTRILFGQETYREVPALAAPFGSRVLFVSDSMERSEGLVSDLRQKGFLVELLLVNQEPSMQVVLLAMRNILNGQTSLVISFGGGSVIDTGKAAAAFATNPGDPFDYLEVVGKGKPLQNASLPHIAIPTTAGTGSEVTRNAVISIPEKRLKVSLRSLFMVPEIAVVDPVLTCSLPASITATTGLDALTQLIEPFVSSSPTPLTDALCRDGIARVARSLLRACENPLDSNARQDMSLASLFGGMALANARLGAVHGMASPIGGMTQAPHGAICACLLPLVMAMNLRALRSREPGSPVIGRYTEIAQLLTGNTDATSDEGINWLKELCQAVGIRPLSDFGLRVEDYPILVEQSKLATSMKGNPVALSDSELTAILEESIGN